MEPDRFYLGVAPVDFDSGEPRVEREHLRFSPEFGGVSRRETTSMFGKKPKVGAPKLLSPKAAEKLVGKKGKGHVVVKDGVMTVILPVLQGPPKVMATAAKGVVRDVLVKRWKMKPKDAAAAVKPAEATRIMEGNRPLAVPGPPVPSPIGPVPSTLIVFRVVLKAPAAVKPTAPPPKQGALKPRPGEEALEEGGDDARYEEAVESLTEDKFGAWEGEDEFGAWEGEDEFGAWEGEDEFGAWEGEDEFGAWEGEDNSDTDTEEGFGSWEGEDDADTDTEEGFGYSAKLGGWVVPARKRGCGCG
jgi:hypothetical protein